MPRCIGFETTLLAKIRRRVQPGPYPASMAAFLSIDTCGICHRNVPWEFVPAVVVRGPPLAGTGVWHSQLVDGCCPRCVADSLRQQESRQREAASRARFIQLFGEKPYRDFTLERFVASRGTERALQCCQVFDPSQSLYLWGPCGVGKTHLAYAAARRCVEEAVSAQIVTPWQLARQARMKEPAEEQAIIDRFVDADVLLVDDIGKGSIRPFAAHLLQEIFDRRDFNDRSGLLVTSHHSLDDLAAKLGDDSLPSRLAGLCTVIEMSGADHRLTSSRRDLADGRILEGPRNTTQEVKP